MTEQEIQKEREDELWLEELMLQSLEINRHPKDIIDLQTYPIYPYH